MSPPNKNFIHETLGDEDRVFGEPADREAEQLIAEQAAEAAEQTRREHGDPADPLHDLPPDWGEPKPKRKASRMNVALEDEQDDERFDGGDFDPPAVDDPNAYGFDSGQAGDAREDRFELYALDKIVIGDDPTELIPDILPMGPALAVVYGPPKSLKSFFVIHAGLHIGGNLLYCRREVQSGAVVYVTAEGVKGTRRRLVGARRALGLEGKGVPFFLVPAMPNLGAGAADREALEKKIRATMKDLGIPVRMIVIDTMRRAMPGKSENKQEDISIVVDNCEALSRAFDCLVVLVHHSPRSDDDRSCGSNALDAAADVMIGCKRDEVTKIATVTVHRLKDGEEGACWSFELRPIEIGVDRQRAPIVSRYVEITQEPERRTAASPATTPLTAAQQRIYDILVGAVADVGVAGAAGPAAPPYTRAITRATLVEYLKRGGWWSDNSSDRSAKENLRSRLNEIAGKHRIGLTDKHVWPVLKRQRGISE